MEKVITILKKIYGYGITIALFGGGLTLLGFIAAMFIGGETATAICEFIYKKLFTWLFVGSNIVVLLGLVAMYLSKEKSMTLEKRKKKRDKSKADES